MQKWQHSSAPYRKVRRVQFGILGPDEIVSIRPLRFRVNYRTPITIFWQKYVWRIIRQQDHPQ
jgi:hypothetical protein